MKRSYRAITTVGVAAAFVISMSACSTTASTGSATTSTEKKDITIAFVMGAEADPFFQAMKVGAEDEAKAEGVKLIWQGDPSKYSAETQIPIVDAVLAQQPTGLVLIPTDPKALQASVAKATAAGIPVVNVDTHVADLKDVVSFITGDNADGGSKAADALATQIGYKTGGSYKVVVGLTSATATTNVSRLDGFKAQVAAKYPGVEIVDVAYSESNPETAATNVSNWLTKYPDLNGIFAIDGTNASGAAAALESKGLSGKIGLVGYDAYPDNVAKIKSGIFTALVAQDPAAEARLAIKTLVEFINTGKTATEHEVVIPNVVLNSTTSDADFAKYTYVK
ncbi:substrate-binding domain-containing protein [Cryobacterium zhongshanensis]|uniref:Substrate-binding domain-containing protein n=1 Tax=Cryobacterium zhongshanensis TaxID=2928153 RepID=A0AA41QS08_9MICO|nr:substrate-binding domain-containing protein [Cryobacterium zhongshanensis]MCI4656384.1 substrate-binding domain-containing protein [Cryobacterium zhongshanensis]